MSINRVILSQMLHYLQLGYGPLTAHISEGSWARLLENAWKKFTGCLVTTSTLSEPIIPCKPPARSDRDALLMSN